MYNIFKCPECGKAMALPSCSCGYTAPYNHGVYQLTDDPYMRKDDSAEVKYIGYEDIGEAYSSGDAFILTSDDEKHNRVAEIIGDGIFLDLACGDGLDTVPLLKRGVHIISMDISDKMLSLLYRRAKNATVDVSALTVCRANALDIPLIDNSVDAAMANSMLHLISKPEIIIHEIFRVLKKGGKYISLADSPSTEITSGRHSLSDEEKADNEKHKSMISFFHSRYFQILRDEYSIFATRYSWKFDRKNLCDELFESKETFIIPMSDKIQYTFNNTFLRRMQGKGYSDQSDVPLDIHKSVFDRVMTEFTEKYGKNAVNTVYTGYQNDVEITVYIK